MKKVLSVFLIILSAIFCCGCSKKISADINGYKKLTFWSIQLRPIYEKEINNVIKEFENQHPEYKVVWVDIPIQEAQKRTLASILSSTPPDVVNLNPDFSILLAQKNALYYFDENISKNFNQNLVEKLMYKDKIYALPFYATSPVTVYNKENFSKCLAGESIKNYDDLFMVSKKVKDCSKIPVFASSINENDVFAKILNKYNIDNIENAEKIAKTKKLYSNFNSMYKSGYLPKDILSLNHREVVEKYMSNKVALIVTGSNFINMIKQNASDVYKKTEISTQLTGENGKYDIALMNLVIPKKSNNIDAAIDFIMLLTNEENQLILSKLTNVLPANKEALKNDYFKTCSDDLVDKARCISVLQLNNINNISFGDNNKSLINENINKTLEEVLLSNTKDEKFLQDKIQVLSDTISKLQESN